MIIIIPISKKTICVMKKNIRFELISKLMGNCNMIRISNEGKANTEQMLGSKANNKSKRTGLWLFEI